MNIVVASFFLLSITIYNAFKLRKQKKIKEMYIYISLMILASYLVFGIVAKWHIPNPTNGIREIFQPIQTWFFKLLT